MSLNLGIVLDIAIGMVFTYTLLAILVSGVQEAVAGWLSLRGSRLRDGIGRLLAGTDPEGGPDKGLFAKVFGHGLIEDISSRKLPAYVPSRNFSLAVIEALKDGSQTPIFSQVENSIVKLPPGTARDALTALVTQAAGDIDALKKGVETWFDDGMDRISGEYKRRSQLYLFVIGMAVAVSLNVDSISLVRTLATDDVTRVKMVELANTFATKGDIEKVDARATLASLPLQIGWREMAVKPGTEKSAWELFKSRFNPVSAKEGWKGEGVWLVVGWLITGLAATLGAPYWFALLQQLLNLRNSGVKPVGTKEKEGVGK